MLTYEKAKKYDRLMPYIMGPNPLKLTEELMQKNCTPMGSTVMDLGSGQGLTSLFLAKEYGFRVIAADLWSDPEEVTAFLESEGLSADRVRAVHADATALPFEKAIFDGAVCVDSYNYFGRDKNYLDGCLAPVLKPGAYVYLAVPGMKKDCHDALPKELLLSWTPEQLDYLHDVAYWKDIFSATKLFTVETVYEMESNDEVWNDWLKQENEYAVGDRKSMEAGGGKYLNFVAAVLRRKN